MMRRTIAVVLVTAIAANTVQAQPPGGRAGSPAASRIPESAAVQTFPSDLVAVGETVFASQCGFCHGREAMGGAGGADLTRSELVAQDVGGNRIGPVVREGRIDAGMPAFAGISASDLNAIVAFIHTQKSMAETLEGGRQGVSTDDLLTGDAAAGERYFQAQCSGCHSARGDLAGIASRMQGLRLLQRMLYPRAGGFGQSSVRSETRVTVTTASGEVYAGVLDYEDAFLIALREADGTYRSFPTRNVSYEIDNPLDGHKDLLGRYTDEDMHDVITYLHTLQ